MAPAPVNIPAAVIPGAWAAAAAGVVTAPAVPGTCGLPAAVAAAAAAAAACALVIGW